MSAAPIRSAWSDLPPWMSIGRNCSYIRLPRAVLSILPLFTACASPSGPGGDSGPTGRIFFQWIIPGDPGARPQVMVVPAAGGTPERVPIWFLDANNPTVDTAGSLVAFMAPGSELATVSPNDSSIFRRVSQVQHRSRPRISLDGRHVAMIFSPPLGANAEVRLIDLASGTERVAGVLPNFIPGATPEYRVYAWFPGGDSLLVGALDGLLYRYYVVQSYGSRVESFQFAPALGARPLALSNDGRLLALSGTPRDSTGTIVEIWDLERRVKLDELQMAFEVDEIAWSPNSRYLVYSPAGLGPLTSGLFVVEVATGVQTPLLPPANTYAAYPSWSN